MNRDTLKMAIENSASVAQTKRIIANSGYSELEIEELLNNKSEKEDIQ